MISADHCSLRRGIDVAMRWYLRAHGSNGVTAVSYAFCMHNYIFWETSLCCSLNYFEKRNKSFSSLLIL
jgi:hypothetical protein